MRRLFSPLAFRFALLIAGALGTGFVGRADAVTTSPPSHCCFLAAVDVAGSFTLDYGKGPLRRGTYTASWSWSTRSVVYTYQYPSGRDLWVGQPLGSGIGKGAQEHPSPVEFSASYTESDNVQVPDYSVNTTPRPWRQESCTPAKTNTNGFRTLGAKDDGNVTVLWGRTAQHGGGPEAHAPDFWQPKPGCTQIEGASSHGLQGLNAVSFDQDRSPGTNGPTAATLQGTKNWDVVCYQSVSHGYGLSGQATPHAFNGYDTVSVRLTYFPPSQLPNFQKRLKQLAANHTKPKRPPELTPPSDYKAHTPGNHSDCG